MKSELHALLGHISALMDDAAITLEDASARVSEFIQGQINCSRVSVWVFRKSERGRVMRRLAGYDGVAMARFSEPAVLVESEFQSYFDALRSQGTYVCNDCFADERLAAMRERYLLPNDIRASMDATIGFNGSTLAVICCAQQGEAREWSGQDLALVRRVAAEISVRRARRLAHSTNVA